MKNVILFTPLLFVLLSCVDTIDKKVTKEHFVEDMKIIKEKYASTYTKEDFNTVQDEAGMAAFVGVGVGKTYKELLDETKACRLKQKERLDRLNQSLKMELLDFAKIEVNNRCAWAFEFNMVNSTKKDIRAFKGTFYMTDLFGEVLDSIAIQCDEPIKAKSKAHTTTQKEMDINDAGEAKLFLKTKDNVKCKFVPHDILFSDGSSL